MLTIKAMSTKLLLWVCITSCMYCCNCDTGSATDKKQEEHLRTLKTEGGEDVKCGKLPLAYYAEIGEQQTASERIVNGKPAGFIYPWLVQVWAFMGDRRPNLAQGGSPPNLAFSNSGGSIITEKIILTCAHCLCGTQVMHQTDEER